MPVARVHVPPLVLSGIARSNAALARWLGYAPMLTPGKVRELCEPEWLCNNQPLTHATGWTPSVGLARGLERTFG